jgi:hypothetical protein
LKAVLRRRKNPICSLLLFYLKKSKTKTNDEGSVKEEMRVFFHA